MYCPFCGKELLELSNKAKICPDGLCRGVIAANKIGQLSLEGYAKYIDEILDIEKHEKIKTMFADKYFMLLKKESDEPMLFNNTSSPLEKNKQTLCIIKCKSHEEAVKSMKEKFKIMNITPEMVVEVNVRSKV